MIQPMDIVAAWDFRRRKWRRATVVATNVRSVQPIATVVVEGRYPWTAVLPLNQQWVRAMRVLPVPQPMTVAA